MHTVFTISLRDKLTVRQKIKAFFNIPILELKYLYPDCTQFCVAELILDGSASTESARRTVRAAFDRLFKLGVRSVLLPPMCSEQDARDAGLCPYDPGNTLFFHAAPYVLSELFSRANSDGGDVWCTFFSDRIGTVFENAVLSNVGGARYISIDCGEFSELLAGVLLREYGVSAPSKKDCTGKKILALFAPIDKKKLWQLEPDVIIDFFGQDIDYQNAAIIRGAEFSLPEKFTACLPDDINIGAFFSLLFESGHAGIEQFKILRLM